jgi:hypothetical protein
MLPFHLEHRLRGRALALFARPRVVRPLLSVAVGGQVASVRNNRDSVRPGHLQRARTPEGRAAFGRTGPTQ